MRATVRRFHSPDALDLDSFVPNDPGDVAILIQAMVGPADEPGEESFDVVVCTPRWIERLVREGGPLLGRHNLIVEKFDSSEVREHLTRLIEAETAPTWEELATRIGRIGMWEFEDYRP
jgi:hypothetical protein